MTIPSDAPVLSIGEILIDLIASDGATDLEHVNAFAARPGGAPANAAVALARQGVPAAYCGVIGNDPFGKRLISTLDEESVDRTRVRHAAGATTTLAFAWKDEGGDGHFYILRMADRLLNVDDVEAAGIGQLAALIIGSVSLSEEPSRTAIDRAVTLAHQLRVPICIDVNMRPAIWPDRESAIAAIEPVLQKATMVKLSLDDAKFFLPDVEDPTAIFHALARYPARFVVLTDGARGSWFANRGANGLADPEFVPAFSMEAVDPTGAGDAFTAGVIARLIENGWSSLSRNDGVYASAAGALTTTKRGAIASLPTKHEIFAFLESRGCA